MKKSENCNFKIFGPTIEMFKKRGRPRKYFSEEERINAERMSRKRNFSNREWRCEYCNNFNYTLARKWNHQRTKKHIENVERKKLEDERKNQISIWRCELCNDVKYDLKSKWNHLRTKRHLENLKNKKVEEGICEIKNSVEKIIEQKFNEKIDKIKKCILTHINQND